MHATILEKWMYRRTKLQKKKRSGVIKEKFDMHYRLRIQLKVHLTNQGRMNFVLFVFCKYC